MLKRTAILGALLVSAPASAKDVPWFQSNTPLTQAHKHLLNNDLPAMFSSLVEVWQLEKNQTITPHLNDLLLQSLEVDCGKTLDTKPLPDWLNSVIVRRTDIQSPGRNSYRASVEIESRIDISDISLTKWVSRSLTNDNALTAFKVSDTLTKYVKRYNLNSRMTMGLYRIDVTGSDDTTWSSWLVLGEDKAKVTVRWQSKDQWKVEKNALLNPHCPLPKLDVSLYDFVDGKYNRVWGKVYESDYPSTIDSGAAQPGRYVLAVAVNQTRWQGPIIVEQSQTISKTYDVSLEE
ncbi:DUF2861 family protein [Vibrio nereis]|uniref:DUF2861 domain-containing protein n=1 Tax=Vibrio nereis TaxID=693 RepID=A0A0M0HRW6_VIBNE|nr:DUF2861 family protein [Vibrio nereis]KOO04353.1 hypothetical protein AKJ17_05460 [Vibrio nereis]